MAVRMHVTAIRSNAPAEVRVVFTDILGKGFEGVPIHHHGGWVWFRTSVWGVDSKDLNAGICRLAQPGLQFTTSDASCWYVVIHGGPQGQVSFLHLFGYFSAAPNPEYYDGDQSDYDAEDDAVDPELAFLEDEPAEKESYPRKPFDGVADDFADYGFPLPKALCDEWRELDICEAINRLRAWHITAMPDALEAAGIPIDADRLRGVLLWEHVTPMERHGDLGNFPRFLSILGLGGEWDQYIEEAEAAPELDDDDEDDYVAPPRPNYTRDVYACFDGIALMPIIGDPVPLPLAKLSLAGFSAEACSTWNSPTVALSITLPGGVALPEPDLANNRPDAVFFEQTENGFNVGLCNRNWFSPDDLQAGLGSTYFGLLQTLPAGSVIDAAYAVPNEPATYHRFRGVVREDCWYIDEVYPQVSSDSLAGSHDIAEIVEDDRITCGDEREAAALESAARRDPFLRGMNVTRQGKSVIVDFDAGNLPKLLLQIRYPDAWNFGPAQEHAAKEFGEMKVQSKELRRTFAEAARRRAAPHQDKVLWKGTHSWYWAADFLQLDQLDAAPRERFEAAMATLGFTYVGDLVAKKVRDVIVRVYISQNQLCYAVLMGKRTMYLGHEFVSRLADGSGLTTTTNATSESFPKAGIYYRNYPGMEPETLFEKHLEGLERFRTHKNTEPVQLEPTLLGVAHEIDRAFARAAVLRDESE